MDSHIAGETHSWSSSVSLSSVAKFAIISPDKHFSQASMLWGVQTWCILIPNTQVFKHFCKPVPHAPFPVKCQPGPWLQAGSGLRQCRSQPEKQLRIKGSQTVCQCLKKWSSTHKFHMSEVCQCEEGKKKEKKIEKFEKRFYWQPGKCNSSYFFFFLCLFWAWSFVLVEEKQWGKGLKWSGSK